MLSPLGTTVNGAHSWIALPGGFQIEPSEYAKIGLILMIALIFGELRERPPPPAGSGAWRCARRPAPPPADRPGRRREPDLGVASSCWLVVLAA